MELRVGIVGCGLIAGGPVREGRPILGNHAAACREVAGVRLVAAAEPDPQRLAAFGREWDVPQLFPDVARMLETQPLDLVIVATPPEAHEEVCLAVIDAGVRGLLCEKPFTGSAAAARRVVRSCEERGCKLVVNFTRRWDSSHRALARRIAAGELGDIRQIFASYTGTMRGNGAHFVDTLQMLVPGEWCVGWTSGLPQHANDGAIEAVLEQGQEARAFVAPVRGAEYFVFEIHVLGTKRRARLMLQGSDIRIDSPKPHPAFPGYRYLTDEEVLPPMSVPSAFASALRALADAVREERDPDVAPDAYVRSLTLLDSIVRHAHDSEVPR
jgi:predicted dehydrogenase